jgi:integrase
MRGKPDLWKHDNGRWYICWKEHGISRRVSTGSKDKGRAVALLADFLQKWNTPNREVGGFSLTVNQAIDYYISEIALEGRAVNEYDFARVREYLGELPSTSITPSVCRNYRKNLPAASNGTVRKQLTMLRAALKYCAKNKQITSEFDFWLPQSRSPRDRWLSKDEAKALISCLKRPYQKTFVQLALATGARRSAVCQLHKSQYARGVLDMRPIQQTTKRRGLVPVIKDSPLDAIICGAIRRSRSGYLIEHAGRNITPITATIFVKAAALEAGLGAVTPHTLKHTACVHMAQAGVPLEDIADYTATSLKTIHENYLHHTPERGMRAARALMDIV